MKKHISILIALFFVLFLTLSVIVTQRIFKIGNNYLNRLEIGYRSALGQLSDTLEETEIALKKIEYSSGINTLHKATDAIISSCASAKSSAATLPFSENNSNKIETLLSLTEDYSRYIGNKLLNGENLNSEELKNFSTLIFYINNLKENINSIRTDLSIDTSKGGISEILSVFSSSLSLPESERFDKLLSDFSNEAELFDGIIYDGPFSSHIKRRIALFLENRETVSESEALKIAADFLDTDESKLKLEYETEGALASFEFKSENSKILVTKKGGEISYAKITGDFLENNLNYEEALTEAKKFLEESGLKNLKETEYTITDNLCIINFCPYENGIIFYPDLIKITVELNEGKMVEYEAEGYLMNHRDRGEIKAKLNEEEAKEFINKNMEIKEISLALIPTEGLDEILCYEFRLKSEDEKEILSYINAETGSEEQIYIVNRSENQVFLD